MASMQRGLGSQRSSWSHPSGLCLYFRNFYLKKGFDVSENPRIAAVESKT